MFFLEEPMRCFFLHDSSVKTVICEDSLVIFCFDKGFWTSNHVHLNKCKILLKISSITPYNIDKFFVVKRKKKNRTKDIQFCDLCKLLNRDTFKIEKEYYSEFERSILLVGRIVEYEYEITVTDIDEIKFEFEQ